MIISTVRTGASYRVRHESIARIQVRRACLAAVLLGGGFFFWGDKHGVETMAITRATPDQLVNAMQQDAFYSNYRGSTLLVEGTIESVTDHAGATIVKLVTTSSFTVLCNLGHGPATPRADEAVTVVAEGAAAQRQARRRCSPAGLRNRALDMPAERCMRQPIETCIMPRSARPGVVRGASLQPRVGRVRQARDRIWLDQRKKEPMSEPGCHDANLAMWTSIRRWMSWMLLRRYGVLPSPLV